MNTDLKGCDDTLSIASSAVPLLPRGTKVNFKPPVVCSYVPHEKPRLPSTYSLPSTPESDLSLATKVSFAKDSVLSKLGLGQKSEAQLEEERLEKKRKEEREVRAKSRISSAGRSTVGMGYM